MRKPSGHKLRETSTSVRARARVRPKKRKNVLVGMDNTRDVDFILERFKIPQDILGLSNANLTDFYEEAVGFLWSHQLEEAREAFALLTKINPYVADFWVGLGLSYQKNEALRPALQQFLVALTMDPSRSDIYGYAIECCLQMQDFSQARAILDEAKICLRQHPRDIAWAPLRAEIPILAKKISEF